MHLIKILSTCDLYSRYNGFCKGVLWPVLHNVTSVYSSRPDGGGGERKNDDSFASPNSTSKDFTSPGDSRVAETLSSVSSRFSEYDMDDVAMGNIHGDGGKEASLTKDKSPFPPFFTFKTFLLAFSLVASNWGKLVARTRKPPISSATYWTVYKMVEK